MSKKYEEPTKLQLELMINKGMGIKEIQKEKFEKESENMATQEEMLEEIKRLENVGLNLEEENKVLKTSNEALMKENEEYQAKIKELKFQLEVVSKNRAYENSGREIKTDDPVSHPNHYCQGGHECIDEMLIVFGVEAVKHFCLLNVWKYRKRALFKNGQQDIDKADWYMNKYFELSEQE